MQLKNVRGLNKISSNGCAVTAHQLDHEVKIMDGRQRQSRGFPSFEQVVEVGHRVMAAGVASAGVFDGL